MYCLVSYRLYETKQDYGYVYFEDGVETADLEMDFSQFTMSRDMIFRLEIVDVRGCTFSQGKKSNLNSYILIG